MKLKTRIVRRRFELINRLNIPFLAKWANEVIESIEKDKLLVYDPKDEKALDCVFDKKGNILLHTRAKTPIKISEWLCVACQSIKMATTAEKEKDLLAFYESNAAQVLWPPYAMFRPQGPAAFRGEIVVTKDIELSRSREEENKFKCIIAHELVHVFDHMMWIVPAFMDWPNFWIHMLGGGTYCDVLLSLYMDTGLFVDSYGQKNELKRLKEYWPSQAKTWFDALRKNKGSG